MKLIQWIKKHLNRPDPLREELRKSKALTVQLCDTMEQFERTMIRYQSRKPVLYGRRSEDETIPRRA